MLATGALTACGRGATPAPAPTAAPQCSGASLAPGSPNIAAVNKIFSDPIFNGLDKTALAETFDISPQIQALYQGYFVKSGQQPQVGNVIASIPSGGIVIQTPGTYTFGGNIQWNPKDAQCSAITIQCSDVILNLAGFTLTAIGADKTQQITGITIGTATSPTISNITITNGTIANVPENGILATGVVGLNISAITVTGVCMQNLCTRFLAPAGIKIDKSLLVALADCTVTNLNVTTDSCAAIFLLNTAGATVTNCTASSIVNHDGAVQGFSYINCIGVTTTNCASNSLQSHFNGNVLTTGHTVLGFCPIFCWDLNYVNCSASGLTGACDDCHGMSVFLNATVMVTGFQANNVVDGPPPYNTGAKATGLEVYGVDVTLTGCTSNNIKAINPQDRQAAGFSAWGLSISFQNCTASNVTAQDDFGWGSQGVGFGWAPDPRPFFRSIGAWGVLYTDCTADTCQVGFDTWFHVNSVWTSPVHTNCGTGILVEPKAMRTLTCDPCSECKSGISVTLVNFETGNLFL